MKKLLLLALIILGATSCFAQTRSKLVHNDSILVKIDSMLHANNAWLEQIELVYSLKLRYKLYQTENIYPFLQLDTKTGEEVNKEYSLQNLLSSIRQYGHPREEEDGAHYKLMESPVFGLFNACFLVDEYFGCSGEPKSALFVYCFNNTPYLYYTELTRFFDLIKSFLPEKMKNEFQKEYVDEICSRDKRRAMDARFYFECPDLNLSFSFYGDPISPVPCPMMQVRFA